MAFVAVLAMDSLIGDKVIVKERRREDQLAQKGFGERSAQGLVLDLCEALYLLEKEKIEVADAKGNALDAKGLLAHAEKSIKKFYKRYVVYKDLRERGYVAKTGFKFGFDLRVYPRGKRQGEAHTQWVVAVLTEGERLTMQGFSRMVRLSSNLKTMLLLAVVDSENDVNYYEVKRLVP